MENKNSAFKEFISPILVLVVICFVTTFLLAFTYGVTAPIIAETTAKAASEARMELLLTQTTSALRMQTHTSSRMEKYT